EACKSAFADLCIQIPMSRKRDIGAPPQSLTQKETNEIKLSHLAPSCPALCRASTPLLQRQQKDVDGTRTRACPSSLDLKSPSRVNPTWVTSPAMTKKDSFQAIRKSLKILLA